MFAKFKYWATSCWRTAGANDAHGELLSCLDVGRHPYGEFSMACLQANQLNEDYCQVETCPSLAGTFVGVYDGHGGHEAARFIKDNLFPQLMRFVVEMGGMSAEALSRAFDATERGFESLVAGAWPTNAQLAAVGSCCLAGVICGVEAVRQELKALHPEDSSIVVLRHGVWRVKGIIQVSRSIGDVYLKKQEFNKAPLLQRFRLPALPRPVLTAEPAILVHELQPHDRFLIFASDGLWEHLSNQEAVEIVNKHPHQGAARRLVSAALKEAARKREVRYADLKKIKRGVRRHFHDDITVIVVFLDHELVRRAAANVAVAPMSVLDSHSVSSSQQNW